MPSREKEQHDDNKKKRAGNKYFVLFSLAVMLTYVYISSLKINSLDSYLVLILLHSFYQFFMACTIFFIAGGSFGY